MTNDQARWRSRTRRAGVGVVIAALATVLTATGCGSSGGSGSPGSKKLTTVTVVTQPFVLNDATWMAQEHGFFKREGLDVKLVPFSSGTTATQAFKTGQGDLWTGGDLPAIQNWSILNGDARVMAVIERDWGSYWAMARKDITSAQSLVGKKIATRVGSTGSYFIDKYLEKNGVSPSDVSVINLETQNLTPALCKNEIQAYFIWEPYPMQTEAACGSDVHRLSSAKGYIHGYEMLMGRSSWLQQHPDVATAYLKALRSGADWASKHPKEVAQYFNDNFQLPVDQSMRVLPLQERPIALDKQFYRELCDEYRWAQSTGTLKPSQSLPLNEWTWRKGLEQIDPKLAPSPPNGGTCPK